MKDKSVEELEKELATMKTKQKLNSDIEILKNQQKNKKSFVRTFGRGLAITGKTTWGGIVKASKNMEASDRRLQEAPKTARPLSPPARMYLPHQEPVKKDDKKQSWEMLA